MRKHWRYLKYVALHKLYVAAAGLAIAQRVGRTQRGLPWLWRLLVHDLSKFRPSEWQAYAVNFYANDTHEWLDRMTKVVLEASIARSIDDATTDEVVAARAQAEGLWSEEKRRRRAAFNLAWLKHIHRNPHHWQHWMLHEDSGKTLVLLQQVYVVDEMVADWIGAGTKILNRPTLPEAIGATVAWYMQNRAVIQLRDMARERVEYVLWVLARDYGLMDLAYQVRSIKLSRAHIEVPQMAASRR